MANANVARGLVPYRHFDGQLWNGSANAYFVPSSYGTALFIGDPVDIISSSNDNFGVPAVQRATSGSPVVGVVVGIVSGGQGSSYTNAVTRDLPIYHPASTAQYLLVADDPTLMFWIQDDASTQNSFAPNVWPGKNANYSIGSGSTVTGYSGAQLTASSVATTNTLDLRIMRALDQADNAIGTTVNTNMNAKWLVILNNRRYTNQIAGV